MGIYRGQIVLLNVEKRERKYQEFNFRPFTLREIYKVIDNLDSNKAPWPGYINAWALKSGKYALGTHLQITFNDCIQERVFPTILKDAHKVFERLLLNQLVEYLEKFALVNKKQFGFQS